MVGQRMGSQGLISVDDFNVETQAVTLIGTRVPKSNQFATQGSLLYNLTLDEVQSHLGDLGKPLSSMNIDELVRTVFTDEAEDNPVTTMPADLSTKTVDEVWRGIQRCEKRLERKATLGDMTLEDFLVKAGVVAESRRKNLGIDPNPMVGLPPPPPPENQWMNYPFHYMNGQQQQGGGMMPPVLAPGHHHHPMDAAAAFAEPQMTLSSSPLMGGALSDTQTPGRKRIAPDDVGIAEKSVERRQKRMIKNRESAARSRARKQAYTHELENKVSRLEEENDRLKKQKELEQMLPVIPLEEPKYQLRRTSSAPV